MSRQSKRLLLIVSFLTMISAGQDTPRYDTLYTRGNKMILVDSWDSVRVLEGVDRKADTILQDLKLIKMALGIDTTKTK